MKFGKRLQSQIEETLPEWRDKYLSYKQLKKRLKLISAPECFTEAAFSSPEHDSGVNIPPEEVQACRSSQNGAALNDTAQHSSPPVSSEGQDSSVNGGSDTGAKSSSGSAGGAASDCLHPDMGAADLSAEEVDFIHLLNAELEKFNTFFIEKEEEYVIRLQELKERCEKLKEKSSRSTAQDSESSLNEEMINIRKEIVNFHGEMVLLVNYSSLNYTGLVKILKKHDKRTGALLRMPFIRNVLHQPFFTTELLSKLVRECEMNLQSLFPPSAATLQAPVTAVNRQDGTANTSTESEKHGVQEREEDDATGGKEGSKPTAAQERTHSQGEDVDNIYRSTLAALRTIKELRRGSSTYSIFSLPPFSKGEGDDDDDVKGTPCATIPICSLK